MSNQVIGDLTLLKCLGKGSFGEVYLSTKKGRNEYFATKKMNKKQIDQPSLFKYFQNEIKLLQSLKHPNIVKIEEVKTTSEYYYIVMEYVNGGSLTDCLKKYKQKYGRYFTEEIIQYLMRQTVDAIKYIHNKKIIHRDLKLDNIMVQFYNDNDKNNLNMLKSKVKIIDFGFAIQLSSSNLAFTALGSPINMDPIILQKFTKKGRDINQLGYDDKADIWSLGTICYEMLVGKALFNSETMNDLVKKVENGTYQIPTNTSTEIASFLFDMLQYNSEARLSAEQLSKHPFLNRRVSDFKKLDISKLRNKINSKGVNINIKKNQTIREVLKDNDRPINKYGGNDLPAPEGPMDNYPNKKYNTDKNIPRMNLNLGQHNKNMQKTNSNQYPTFSQNSFYGQNMYPNNPPKVIPPMQQMPIMSPPGFPPQMGGFPLNPLGNFGPFGPPGYSFSSGLYPNNQIPPNMPPPNYGYSSRQNSNYAPMDNDSDDEGNVCLIQ